MKYKSARWWKWHDRFEWLIPFSVFAVIGLFALGLACYVLALGGAVLDMVNRIGK